MKILSKIIPVATALIISPVLMQAKSLGDYNIFNHLGAGVNVGTVGIGFELSTPLTNYVTLRAGATFMPGFSFTSKVDGSYSVKAPDGSDHSESFKMDVKGSLSRAQGDVIFNVYPFPNQSSFFVAVGAYFGGASLVGIKGHSEQLAGLASKNPNIEIGDFELPVDNNGNVKGSLRGNPFRPYLGLGFGRPVPKGRINFNVDLGVQFMGRTKIYNGNEELKPESYLDNDDGWQKWMDKITVYPVLQFTLTGRIF